MQRFRRSEQSLPIWTGPLGTIVSKDLVAAVMLSASVPKPAFRVSDPGSLGLHDQPANEDDEGHQEYQQHPLPALPPTVLLHVLQLLPDEDIALSGRLACKDAALHFTSDRHRTLHVCRPLPPHAQPLLASSMRRLPLRRKISALAAAASSGSETAMDATWRALEPCVFPQLLRTGVYRDWFRGAVSDPGVAAVRAGHSELLPLLLERWRGAMRLPDVLAAAARYCPLSGRGGLQDTWQCLRAVDDTLVLDDDAVFAGAFGAEAGDIGRDRELGRKLLWLRSPGAQTCGDGSGSGIGRKAVEAILSSGRVARMVVVMELGCSISSQEVVCLALRHCGFDDVLWLLSPHGCGRWLRLPRPVWLFWGRGRWRLLVEAAAASGKDGVRKLVYLREQGALSWGLRGCGKEAALAAAHAGDVEVLGYLLHQGDGEAAVRGAPGVVLAAVGSGSVAAVELLLHAGCAAPGLREGLLAAAGEGRLGMLRWLLGNKGALCGSSNGEEALARSAAGPSGSSCSNNSGCGPRPSSLLRDVVSRWPDRGREDAVRLREAVQLLLPQSHGDHTAGDRRHLFSCHDGPQVLNLAVARCDLELVRYLHQEVGCALDDRVLLWAARGGCEELVEWLVRAGCAKDGGAHLEAA